MRRYAGVRWRDAGEYFESLEVTTSIKRESGITRTGGHDMIAIRFETSHHHKYTRAGKHAQNMRVETRNFERQHMNAQFM
jgi:hypothetical protein